MVTSGSGLLATSEGSRSEPFGPSEWALLLGTAIIWGSSYLWIDIALQSLHPFVVASLRIVLGLAAISAVPRARVPIARQDQTRIVVLGIGWFGLPMVTFPIAQDLGVASSVVGMLNGAMPILTTLFASLLLRRRPTGIQVAGLTMGLGGLVLITLPEFAKADATALGVALILATMVSNSLFANMLVPMQQRYGALPVLRGTLTVAVVATAPLGLWGVTASSWSWSSIAAMIPLGLASTALAFVAWTTLIGRVGAARGSIVSYLVPVVAIVLGVAVLDEMVAPEVGLGMVMVLFGAWLVSRSRDRVDGLGTKVTSGALKPDSGRLGGVEDKGLDAAPGPI